MTHPGPRAGKWNKARIADALRSRLAKAMGMNFKAIETSDQPLACAMRSHFGSHDEALRIVGVDPATVRKQLSWDKPRIVAAIRDRLASGLGVNLAAIAHSDIKLSGAIRRYFGSHDDALRAAGINPGPVRQRPVPLDRAAVIAALHDRRDKGLALNFKSVEQSSRALASAIKHHFKSHDRALIAAGIDPAGARKQFPWDRARVIACLRDRAASGAGLHSYAIQMSDNALAGAIQRHFASHADALLAAGIDPAKVRRRTPWDKAKVIAALRDRQEKGLGLNVHAVSSDQPLVGGIQRHFGSHAAALRAAGIDPELVRQTRRPWQREEILAVLRRLAPNGIVPWPLVKSGGASLDRAARRVFGSLPAAMRAAGLEYARPPGRADIGHWTEELVLKSLEQMYQDGHDLRYRHMKEHSQPLFFAAKQFFGSYVNAVKRAGIDYWEMSQAQLAKQRAAAAGQNAPEQAHGKE